MIKLIIQIPCFNEEETLPVTLSHLPRDVPGIDRVEWLVVDDGSTDNTAELARENGVDHIVRFPVRRGLAKAFQSGIDACLQLGADIIVNTDADNQYRADDIPVLIGPILGGLADMVIGSRPISQIRHFSSFKKIMQEVGSYVVRLVSNTDIPDAPSGFRAISRDAAMRLNVFSSYTYTLETIIQAGQKGMTVQSLPVRVNPQLRPSRLVTGNLSYIWRSIITILRIFVVYRPFRFFASLGSAIFFTGFLLGLRFLYYYFVGEGSGKLQSLVLSSILIGAGFQTILTAFVVDLLSVNRKLLEDIQYRLKKIEFGQAGKVSDG